MGQVREERVKSTMTTPPPPPVDEAAMDTGAKDGASLKEAGNKAFAKGDLEQAYRVRMLGSC